VPQAAENDVDLNGILPGLSVFERGWLSSNNILLRSPGDCVLVDSGYWTHSAQTVGLVEHLLGQAELTCIINTHLHSDHCGGNAALQARYPNCGVLVPEGLAASVHPWDPVALTYVPTGQHCPPFRHTGLIHPQTTVRLADNEWQVHGSPGHDPDSVILFQPGSRVLLSADALWEQGFGVLFPELAGHGACEDAARTLDLIAKLQPDYVIPGHGRPFREIGAALASARTRLESFAKDPRKHARHGAKVLLKFRLLEIRRCSLDAMLAWAEEASYFRTICDTWFASVPVRAFAKELLESLVASKAAEIVGSQINDL
jgi:glyoxylase-like metal-dependent hydrolase (beta-lactamase superfamily II)